MRHLPGINLTKLLLILFVGLFISSCSDKAGKKELILQSLQQSFENSNKSISISSQTILRSLEDKTTDYLTKEKADVWYPKAKQVSELTREVLSEIEMLKNNNNPDQQKLRQLFTRIIKYKEQLLNTDPKIKAEFEKNILPATISSESNEVINEKFYEAFFTSGDEYSVAMLTKLQNDIRVAENKLLAYSHDQTAALTHHEGFYSAIVGQNTRIVEPGGNLELTVGIGSISMGVWPKIIINGKVHKSDDTGVTIIKIKAPQNIGTYTVPVTISYLNYTTGKDETKQFNIEYTVKDCN